MSRVAVASAGGAPGVTTLVTGLASVSDPRPLLVVECPPDGGVLAARWGWSRPVGVVDVTVDATSGQPAETDLWAAARPWIGPTRLLPGDPAGVTMRQPEIATALAGALATVDRPTVADVGRLHADPPSLQLLETLGRLWLLVDPVVEQVTTAAAWRGLLERTCTVELLVTDGRLPGYRAREVAATLGWPLAGTVPDDPATAAALTGRAPPRRGWRTAPLLRTAAALRDRLDRPPSAASVATAGSGGRP